MELVIRADNLPEQIPVPIAATEIQTPTAESPAATGVTGVTVVAALLPGAPPHIPELLPAPLPARLPAPPPSPLLSSAPNAPAAPERSAQPASGWITIVPGDKVAKVPEVTDWMLADLTRPDSRPASNTPVQYSAAVSAGTNQDTVRTKQLP
jgi:LysM repeat protein